MREVFFFLWRLLEKMIRAIIPLIVGWFIIHRQECVSQRQSPQVSDTIRQTVWPIMLVLMGLAWHLAHVHGASLVTDALYAAVVMTTSWWMYVQSCEQNHEKAKLLLLLAAAVTGLLTYQTARVSIFASCMLTLVLIWLLFAEQLQLPHISIRLPSISVELPKISFSP